MNNLKQHLLNFLIDWLNWAEGKPEYSKYHYHPHEGLCHAAFLYTNRLRYTSDDFEDLDLSFELNDMFTADNFDLNYPFGELNYRTRYADDTQHKCPLRLAWVKKAIERLQTELSVV